MKKNLSYRLVLSGLFVAVGILLPYLFHSIPNGGRIFLPMHLPVLLCGFLCGAPFGAAVGAILPLLSSVLTGMPALYPDAVVMMCELAVYGLITGLLSRRMPVYPALLIAMLAGRITAGVMRTILVVGIGGGTYTWGAFLTASFVTALPGIALQLVLVPGIVYLARRYMRSSKA